MRPNPRRGAGYEAVPRSAALVGVPARAAAEGWCRRAAQGCGSRVGFGSDAGLDGVLGPGSDCASGSDSDSDFADRACGARRVRR